MKADHEISMQYVYRIRRFTTIKSQIHYPPSTDSLWPRGFEIAKSILTNLLLQIPTFISLASSGYASL